MSKELVPHSFGTWIAIKKLMFILNHGIRKNVMSEYQVKAINRFEIEVQVFLK